MSLLHAVGGSGAEDKLYVEDVFSTYLYTGNGSTQTINNGIDLAGKGGMVWIKERSINTSHYLFDTEQGKRKWLMTNLTNDTSTTYSDSYDFGSFNSNGFSLLGGWSTNINISNNPTTSWTFRKAPKFFDIVTYTGDGVAGRQIPHNLGCEVGMIVVKKTSTAGTNWIVYHRALGDAYLILNLTNASGATSVWNNTAPTSTMFTLGNSTTVNESGQTYVAYLFAHDPSADGIIQCGSFTTDGSGSGSYNTSWSIDGAQYAEIKCVTAVGDWEIYDTARTPSWSSTDARLRANLANAEDSVTRLSASSGVISFTGLSASQTYIIKTIRGV